MNALEIDIESFVLVREHRGPIEHRIAYFSNDERYRYSLMILWGSGDLIQYVGLNPSTADEMKDDNTVRRCKNWAIEWGFSGMIMTNLFAYRSTDPKVMKAQTFPVGENLQHYTRDCMTIEQFPKKSNFTNLNDLVLAKSKLDSARTVICWGNHGAHLNRSKEFREWFGSAMCFKKTKTGEPSHPLYLPNNLRLEEYV